MSETGSLLWLGGWVGGGAKAGGLPGQLPTSTTFAYGGFPKLGNHFRGPHNKDYSILGSPYLGKLQYFSNLF